MEKKNTPVAHELSDPDDKLDGTKAVGCLLIGVALFLGILIFLSWLVNSVRTP